MVVSRQVANIDSQNLTDEHLTDLDHLVIQGLDNPLVKYPRLNAFRRCSRGI